MATDITLERTMPANLEAERAVLGAILLHPPGLFEVRSTLSRDDFYAESNRLIFDAMLELQASDTAIDMLTVKAELKRTDNLERCGGAPYVASLTNDLDSASNLGHYCELVREESVKRQVIQLTNEAMARSFAGEDKSQDVIEALQMALLKISGSSKSARSWLKISDLVHEAYGEIEAMAHRKTDVLGIDTGFRDLNALTQGLKKGELVIIAGRPGHGKTSFAMNLVANSILRQGKRAALFTIEMTAVEIIKRVIYSEAEVDSHRVGRGMVTKDDWRRIGEAAGRLTNTHLSVDESGSLGVMEIRSKAQRLAAESGVDLIVIDYLQLMSGPKSSRERNRVQEISDISRELKSLAKDLEIPIVALSQLNREVEKEAGRRPRLSDLRESGSLEQDADLVLFIWREELRKRTEENIGKAELIIGKQRNGPVGETVNLAFMRHYTKFVDGSARSESEAPQNHQFWYGQEA